MPGFYSEGEYDLAGFIVGVVDRDRIITGKDVKPGDVLIGLPSTGLHTNGYSLARKLFFSTAHYTPESYVNEIKGKVGTELMRTHKSYWPIVRRMTEAEAVTAMAHITGGGITENLPRVLPKNCSAIVEINSWPMLPIFEHLQPSATYEGCCAPSMGISMILVVPSSQEGADHPRSLWRRLHHRPGGKATGSHLPVGCLRSSGVILSVWHPQQY